MWSARNASLRNGSEALQLALQAQQLSQGQNPALLDTLAAAYAEAGRCSEAVETAKHAISQARSTGDKSLAESIAPRLKLYEASSACRE